MTGNCFSESTPFFLQYMGARGGDVRGRREVRQRQSGRNEKDGLISIMKR